MSQIFLFLLLLLLILHESRSLQISLIFISWLITSSTADSVPHKVCNGVEIMASILSSSITSHLLRPQLLLLLKNVVTANISGTCKGCVLVGKAICNGLYQEYIIEGECPTAYTGLMHERV